MKNIIIYELNLELNIKFLVKDSWDIDFFEK